jgi:hypothetical protein
MRISVDEADPGYETYVASKIANKRAHVFVDGVEIKQVTMADEEAGYVSTFKRMSDGQLYVTEDGCLIAHHLKGSVKVELRDAG